MLKGVFLRVWILPVYYESRLLTAIRYFFFYFFFYFFYFFYFFFKVFFRFLLGG